MILAFILSYFVGAFSNGLGVKGVGDLGSATSPFLL
jgi:hypothetical protein